MLDQMSVCVSQTHTPLFYSQFFFFRLYRNVSLGFYGWWWNLLNSCLRFYDNHSSVLHKTQAELQRLDLNTFWKTSEYQLSGVWPCKTTITESMFKQQFKVIFKIFIVLLNFCHFIIFFLFKMLLFRFISV